MGGGNFGGAGASHGAHRGSERDRSPNEIDDLDAGDIHTSIGLSVMYLGRVCECAAIV